MAIEQTAETGHDITLATHLVKNFDSYSEELKARVRDFVIESMSQPDGGARRFNIDRLGDYVEEDTDLYLEVSVAPYAGNVQGLIGLARQGNPGLKSWEELAPERATADSASYPSGLGCRRRPHP